MRTDTQAEPTAPLPKRRWLQFRLRTLLALVTLAGIALASIAVPAERQRRAVAAIQSAGGTVAYDHESCSPGMTDGYLPGPDWLCALVGVDYFSTVTFASLPADANDGTAQSLSGLPNLQFLSMPDARVGDVGLAHLRGLKRLERLDLNKTQVTDAGLAHLHGLTKLQELQIHGARVTGGGLADLRMALPGCAIYGP